MADNSSTVPGPNTPKPANNAISLILHSDPSLYVRPTAGGNAAPGQPEGGSGNVPAGEVPANPIKGQFADLDNPMGAAPSAGGTQVGPDMGHGATIVFTHNDDTGAQDDGNYKGTVGPSGPGLGQS